MTPICPAGTLAGSCRWHDGWRPRGSGRGRSSCRQQRGPVWSGGRQPALRGTAAEPPHEGTLADGPAVTDGLDCLRATLHQQLVDSDSYRTNDKLRFSYAANYPQPCLRMWSSSDLGSPLRSSFYEVSEWLCLDLFDLYCLSSKDEKRAGRYFSGLKIKIYFPKKQEAVIAANPFLSHSSCWNELRFAKTGVTKG